MSVVDILDETLIDNINKALSSEEAIFLPIGDFEVVDAILMNIQNRRYADEMKCIDYLEKSRINVEAFRLGDFEGAPTEWGLKFTRKQGEENGKGA